MEFFFEATVDFSTSVCEIDRLLSYADCDESADRSMFLKLSVISLVTKFQVFIEAILCEYKFKIINSDRKAIEFPLYFRMNSLQQALVENNVFESITKHKNFTEEKLHPIRKFVADMNYVLNDDAVLADSLHLCTKFPLGRTGRNELINLLKQIDGDSSLFDKAPYLDLEIFDSLLQTRHRAVHQDVFSGTAQVVESFKDFCCRLSIFIDSFLHERLFME